MKTIDKRKITKKFKTYIIWHSVEENKTLFYLLYIKFKSTEYFFENIRKICLGQFTPIYRPLIK